MKDPESLTRPETTMPVEEAIEVYHLLEQDGHKVWVDGGWGVDALLGEQTRPHTDLDLAVELSSMKTIQTMLEKRGYKITLDEMPTRLELRDSNLHQVDLHPLTFDAAGNGLQQLQDGRFGTYTAQGLTGTGSISGARVNCLSPELQIRFHLGYEPSKDDINDMLALHKKFGLEVPEIYRKSS